MDAGADDIGERGRADLAEGYVLGQQVVGELRGQAHAELAGLAVDDEAREAGRAEVLRDLVRPAEGVVAVRRPAVGDDDQQWPAAGVAYVLEPQHVGGLEQGLGQRCAATRGQLGKPGRGDVDRAGRRKCELGAVLAERDEPDLVAALVGVHQKRQDRGLDLLHALARGHRAGGVDAEQDQVGLVPLLDREAQVVGAELDAVDAATGVLVRGRGADRLHEVDRAALARTPLGADASAGLGDRPGALAGLAGSGAADREQLGPVRLLRSRDGDLVRTARLLLRLLFPLGFTLGVTFGSRLAVRSGRNVTLSVVGSGG